MLASLVPDRRAITDIPGLPRWSSSDPTSLIGSPQMRAMATVAGYACVRLICDTVSTLPLRFYRVRAGIDEQIDPPAWYDQPTERELRVSWLFRGLSSLALANRAHLLVTERDRNGAATQAMWLPPSHVRPRRAGELQLVNEHGRPWPMADLGTVQGFLLAGADAALSPVDTFTRFFRLAGAAEEFGARWFEDGAHPTAVLSIDKQLTGQQADQAVDGFVERIGRRRRPILLSGGLKLDKFQANPAESAWIDTEKWVVDQSARIWGVPASLIGGSEGTGLTYNTVEGAALRFHTFTLRPSIVRLEQLISNVMLPRGQWCQFVPDAIFRSSLLDRYQAHQIALGAGFKTPNEVRKLEDMPPLPNGDTLRPQTTPTQGGARHEH